MRRRMLTDRPVAERWREPILRLEVGKAYTARKGSSLRIRYGAEAIYVVIELPPVVRTSAVIQVLGPTGVTMAFAADLRPCEEVHVDED